MARKLEERYANLRVIRLQRDPNRKLGATRNLSIRHAAGDYVLLHLDCDDVFGPYLRDFVEVFHRIEKCVGRDVSLSGQHINMAKRDFLLQCGPYRNIYRGEDRDLWSRLIASNALLPVQQRYVQFRKTIFDTINHMRNDFRGGTGLVRYIRYEYQKRKIFSFRLMVFRWLVLLPCWLFAKFDEPLSSEPGIGWVGSFGEQREALRGTYAEIMRRHGGSPDLSFLRNSA